MISTEAALRGEPPEGCTDPAAGRRFVRLAAGEEPATSDERRQILEHVLHCPACRRLSAGGWFEQNAREIAARLGESGRPPATGA
jgi:hypothetical protein